MITYNPKDWFKLIFQFHKSDTFRILLPSMIILGILTGGLVYIELSNHIVFKSSTIFHQILGFVLSMLLVFRINSAYDRWWEGRKLWGSLVNNTRNLMLKMNSIMPEAAIKERIFLKKLLVLFVFSLKNFLKTGTPKKDPEFFEGLDIENYQRRNHKPNYVIQLIFHEIELLKSKKLITDIEILFINNELQSLADITGACERIKHTPIPYSYSLFLKKIIFIYVITMPVAFSFDFQYWSVPIVMFIFYAFASLEIISEEVEEPFGNDSNDLPLEELCQKIKVGLDELMPG